MKPKEYIGKHHLEDGKPLTEEFWSDLRMELITLLETGAGDRNIKGFNNAVTALKSKWDGIKMKAGNTYINDKAWGWFYATSIVSMKKELFPSEMKQQEQERIEKKKQWEEQNKEWDEFHRENAWDRMRMLFMHMMLGAARPDHDFELLGITGEADEDKVKNAYRVLAMQHHPDRGGKREEFERITSAKNRCLAWLNRS